MSPTTVRRACPVRSPAVAVTVSATSPNESGAAAVKPPSEPARTEITWAGAAVSVGAAAMSTRAPGTVVPATVTEVPAGVAPSAGAVTVSGAARGMPRSA
jgi:hypothetical protein